MADPLGKSSKKVQTALTAMGLDCHVVEMPGSTRTANDAAAAVGCSVGQIVKSLIFQGRESGKPFLVVASGSNRVDEKKLSAEIKESIKIARAGFVREKTGYAIGGVPPLGHIKPIETYIDKDLMEFDEIWAAAGGPKSVFKLTPQDLQKMTSGKIIDLK